MLQRVSFNVGNAEVEGILHLPEREAIGGVAVLPDSGADPERPPVITVCAALAAAGVGALRFAWDTAAAPAVGPTEIAWPDLDRALASAAGAMRLLKAHRQLPGSIGVVGFGFGGAVVAIAAGRDSRVRVAVLCGAPAQIGGSRRPLAELSRTRARVLVVHGARDTTLPTGEAERYRAVLSQARVTHRLVVIDGADHEFAPAGPRERMASEIAAWVRDSF